MVNLISTQTSRGPDAGPRIPQGASAPAAGATPSVHVKTDLPGGRAETPATGTEAKPAAPAPAPLLSSSMVPPLTSLALFNDAESGMQVAVVRDRMSGDVVEQVPTERARRLAAMIRQQEHVAQELRQEGGETPHIDVRT